jgi:MYXO-CTERM domain-containing protein
MNTTKTTTHLAAVAAGLLAACASAQAQLNLIHQWNFNEVGGTTAADSVGSANATLLGAATFNGSGVTLNGTAGTTIDLGNVLNGLSTVTMESWFTYTQVANRAPLFYGRGAASDMWYLRYSLYDTSYQSPNAYLEANNSWGGGGTTLAQTGAPAQNSLQHVAIVYDSANGYQAIYVNGALAVGASQTLLNLNSIAGYDLQLGRGPWTSDPYLTGAINEFSIYDGAASASDIAAHFTAGPVPEPSAAALGLAGFALLGLLRSRRNR